MERLYDDRYSRNKMTITDEEQEILQGKKICILGCGGLGGYNIEMLARMGIGHIVGVDGDVFDETNLNRQIISKEIYVGVSKVACAKRRVAEINSEIEFLPIKTFFKESNAAKLVKGCDLVIDALDNISARLLLEKVCEEENIPFVHGAIAGWCGQVASVMPGDRTLHMLYGDVEESGDKGEETETGNPSFTPAFIAAIQVAEAVKILLNKEDSILRRKILTVDLLSHNYETIEL